VQAPSEKSPERAFPLSAPFIYAHSPPSPRIPSSASGPKSTKHISAQSREGESAITWQTGQANVPGGKSPRLGPSTCAPDPAPPVLCPGGSHHLTPTPACVYLRRILYMNEQLLSRWSRRPNRDKRSRWHPLPRLRSHCVRLIVRWTTYDHRPTSTHTALPCSVELPASAPAREIIKDIQLIVPFTMIICQIPPVGVTPELESPYADIQAFRFYGTHSQGSIAKGR
jgi:hypothetical protein